MGVLRIICCFLFGYCSLVNGTYQPSRILSEKDEVVIPSNTDFSLRCEGKNELKWTTPNNTYDDVVTQVYSSITIQALNKPNKEYPHGSILTISNASYLDTGFYYCHENTEDFQDLNRSSRIYVYVSDDNELSVIDLLPTAVSVIENSEAILPCRPTSPNVTVELSQATGEEVPPNTPNSDGITVTYDPRRGFIINKVLGEMSLVYQCTFRRINNNQEVEEEKISFVYLDVKPIIDHFPKPELEELSDGHTVVGEKLEMQCTVTVVRNMQFKMEWIVPDKMGFKSGRVNTGRTIKNHHHENRFYQILTINQTSLDDQGEYTCVIKSYNQESNATKFVKIFAEKDD